MNLLELVFSLSVVLFFGIALDDESSGTCMYLKDHMDRGIMYVPGVKWKLDKS